MCLCNTAGKLTAYFVYVSWADMHQGFNLVVKPTGMRRIGRRIGQCLPVLALKNTAINFSMALIMTCTWGYTAKSAVL